MFLEVIMGNVVFNILFIQWYIQKSEITKQQWDPTTCLLEWPKFETPTIANADKNVEQQELSFIVGRNAICRTIRPIPSHATKVQHMA